MTTAGIRWAEVREAGRLDRLYREISWTHRKETGTLPAFDRWAGGVFHLVRWGAVAAIVALAATQSPSMLAPNGVYALLAAFFSLPLFRMSRAPELGAFEALRMPSRGALLVARWRDLAPAALVAGGAWAVCLAARLRAEPDVPVLPLALVLAAVALLPLRLATVGAWKKSADGRLDADQSAFLRCVLLGGGIGAIAIALAVKKGAFLVSSSAPAAIALLCLGFAGAHAIDFVRKGAGEARAWGRAAIRVLGTEFAGVLFVLAIAAAWIDPDLLRGETAPGFVGWMAVLGVVASPVTCVLAGALALRDIRFAEVLPAALDRGGRPTESALAEDRGTPRRPSRAPAAIGPGRRERRGAWAAHVGWWWDGMSRPGTFMGILWGVTMLAFVALGISEPVRLEWMLVIAGFLTPRRVGVDQPVQVYLLGMDLREQARHDLRALLLFAALPSLAVLIAAGLLFGPKEGRIGGAALLVAALMLRAGWPGLRNMIALNRIPFVGPWGIAVVALILVGSSAIDVVASSYGWGLSRLVGTGVLGVAGLAILLSRTEEQLREEMLLKAERRTT